MIEALPLRSLLFLPVLFWFLLAFLWPCLARRRDPIIYFIVPIAPHPVLSTSNALWTRSG